MTAVTFDVDFTDYTSSTGEMLDEIDASFGIIHNALKLWPELKTTWFVRVDNHVALHYGKADYILSKHATAFELLRSSGHEIGWHHHAFVETSAGWRPTSDVGAVVAQLEANSDLAQGHLLSATRMGWGFHTNETIATLDALGWRVDSTAMPRPSYLWDTLPRDWSRTPLYPFRPSVADFRVPGEPSRGLVEVPLTMVCIPATGDTQPDVRRYLNPAYRTDVFANAIDKVPAGIEPVMICHPYEVLPARTGHPLIAFDVAAFRANLELIVARASTLSTISEVAARSGQSNALYR